MRRLVYLAALLAIGVPAGVVAATTPPDTTPPETTVAGGAATTAPAATDGVTTAPPTETTAPGDTARGTAPGTTAAPGEAEPVTVFDEEGNPVATITVVSIETAWTDYEEGEEPDEGNEYVRVTVSVQSHTADDETFGVAIDNFILQSNYGFVTTAENILTAAQAEADEEVVTDADLAGGESAELALTFQVVASAGPQSVLFRPDDERLVGVAEFA